jgi:hypothetical protein
MGDFDEMSHDDHCGAWRKGFVLARRVNGVFFRSDFGQGVFFRSDRAG